MKHRLGWFNTVICLALAALGLAVIWTLGGQLLGEMRGLWSEWTMARNRYPVGYTGIYWEWPDREPPNRIREADGRLYLWAGTGSPGQAGWFDVTGTELPLDEFTFGYGRDRINKTIDYPIFESPNDEIARHIYPERLVIGLAMNGEARAYPLRILARSEVVNETFAGMAIAVTFCPLLGKAAVYGRELDGEPISFGTSGYYHEGAFVLYDRGTDSLWYPKPEGLTAITGPSAGRLLPLLAEPAVVTWGQWRSLHPETVVLVGADRSRGIPLPQARS